MNATPPLIRAYAGADAALRALLIGIVGNGAYFAAVSMEPTRSTWRSMWGKPHDGEAIARRGPGPVGA